MGLGDSSREAYSVNLRDSCQGASSKDLGGFYAKGLAGHCGGGLGKDSLAFSPTGLGRDYPGFCQIALRGYAPQHAGSLANPSRRPPARLSRRPSVLPFANLSTSSSSKSSSVTGVPAGPPGRPELLEKLSELLTGEISHNGCSFGGRSPRFRAVGFAPIFLGGRDCALATLPKDKVGLAWKREE
jgi:hypothetical protein